jgi:hypothetical protein
MPILTSHGTMISPNGGMVLGHQSLRACRSPSTVAQPPHGREPPRTPPASLPMRRAAPGEGVGTATGCYFCIHASIMYPCRWCTWTAMVCASTSHRARRTACRWPRARAPSPASPHEPIPFKSCRMIGRGGTRRATVLKPARSNVETIPVEVVLGVRFRSSG